MVYARLREHVKDGLIESVRAGDGPAVVAQVVLKAASSRTPKLRYPAGPLARRLSVLKRIMPATLLGKGIRKINKLAINPKADAGRTSRRGVRTGRGQAGFMTARPTHDALM